jgi:myo-inositol-1(or 4)-monophosphatase
MMTDPTLDPLALLDLAIGVAREAAALARASRIAGLTAADVTTKSTDTDLVTTADRAVERLIVERLRAHRPGDAVLGEESGAHDPAATAHDPAAGAQGRGDLALGRSARDEGPATRRRAGEDSGVRWLVDPIDGTVNYVYGLPHYAVSVAAEVDGLVTVAVVHNAVTGEQWTAVRGHGACRDGEPVTGSTVTSLGQTLVATGFAYDAVRRAHQARVISEVLPHVRDLRRFGSAAIDLCFAADGRVDAYFEQGLQPWDLAAGGLIASEAGLRVTGLRGAPPGPRLVLAAPVGVYWQLHDLLVEQDADRW